jgi:hypothetical protein
MFTNTQLCTLHNEGDNETCACACLRVRVCVLTLYCDLNWKEKIRTSQREEDFLLFAVGKFENVEFLKKMNQRNTVSEIKLKKEEFWYVISSMEEKEWPL